MVRYQRGFLRKKKGKWVYCYSANRLIDGTRTERGRVVGFVSELSKASAWAEVERRGLNVLVNEPDAGKPLTFGQIASHYLENHRFTNHGTQYLHNHIVRDYLIPRFGGKVAVEIQPKEILGWLESQTFAEHGDDGLENSTLGKIKTVMGTVYRHGQFEELIPQTVAPNTKGQLKASNPVTFVRWSNQTDYEAFILKPEQSMAVLDSLVQPEYTLLLLVAATGVRISEALALKWKAVLYDQNSIRIKNSWTYGQMGSSTKTQASKSTVPMHPALAEVLKGWQAETPYNKPDDFVFASFKLYGKKPRTGNMIVEDYLRPAAIKAGVLVVKNGNTYDSDGNRINRFGFHCFRHTLASFLLAQGNNPVLIKNLLRWSTISMLNTYGHVMTDEKIAAQGSMLQRIMPKTIAVQ
jgi:integrase